LHLHLSEIDYSVMAITAAKDMVWQLMRELICTGKVTSVQTSQAPASTENGRRWIRVTTASTIPMAIAKPLAEKSTPMIGV
jgi:hypothetical protein